MSTIPQSVAEGVAEVAGAAFDHVADLVDRRLLPASIAPPEPPPRHRVRWLAVAAVAALTVGWVVVSRRRSAGRSGAAVDQVVDLREEPLAGPGAMNGH